MNTDLTMLEGCLGLFGPDDARTKAGVIALDMNRCRILLYPILLPQAPLPRTSEVSRIVPVPSIQA